MQLIVNKTLSLEVDDESSIGDLTARAASTLGLVRESSRDGWVLATEDGSAYTQDAFGERSTVAEFLRHTASRRLELIPQVICRHGSPGVPGRGHLCGWC